MSFDRICVYLNIILNFHVVNSMNFYLGLLYVNYTEITSYWPENLISLLHIYALYANHEHLSFMIFSLLIELTIHNFHKNYNWKIQDAELHVTTSYNFPTQPLIRWMSPHPFNRPHLIFQIMMIVIIMIIIIMIIIIMMITGRWHIFTHNKCFRMKFTAHHSECSQ